MNRLVPCLLGLGLWGCAAGAPESEPADPGSALPPRASEIMLFRGNNTFPRCPFSVVGPVSVRSLNYQLLRRAAADRDAHAVIDIIQTEGTTRGTAIRFTDEECRY
jgi:hypothetical protein